MTGENYNVRFGLEFVPGQAAARAEQAIRDVVKRAESVAQQGGGILDVSQAERFGAELSKAVRHAFEYDVRNSPLFQSMRREDQRRVFGPAGQPQGTVPGLAQQLSLQQAVQAQQLAVARQTRTYTPSTGPFQGQELKGYGSTLARNEAILAANRKVAAADEALERALRARVTAETRAGNAAQRAADIVRNQRAADEALNAPTSFPGANAGTRVGRAQETVNVAELELARATQRLGEVRNSETRTADQALAARKGVDRAESALAVAEQRLADEYTRARQQQAEAGAVVPKRGGVASQFALGFQGVSDRPYAEQIGQAFKFSLFYGTAYKLLFALTQTFSLTLQEGIAFQQAVTELKLATGQSAQAAKDLANQFGEEASQFGFAPSQGALIGARAQGYYGTTESDLDTQRRVGDISSRVVNQIAFASGRQPDDIQGNLAAVAQAYGLGAGSQQLIGDLDAFFSRKFGIQQGQTIGAIAQSGTVGRAAGFSPAEVAAIAADIMARTGSTEATTGGYLAQIFSRAGEGSLTALSSRYGIDPKANFADQFRELAKVYQARPEDRDDISAAFGRGKVQNAVIALLQDFSRVESEAKAAQTQAPGALQKATDLRLNDIGGQIQQTIGSLREFAQELGDSGVLDAVGAGVVVFRELLDAGTEVLQMFNSLPRPIRDLTLGLAALIAATRLAAATEQARAAGGVPGLLGSGLASRAGVFRSTGVLTPTASGAIIPAGTRAVSTAAGAVPLASAAGARAAAGAAVGGYGVTAAVLADALLLDKTRSATEKFNKAREEYADFLNNHDEDLSTVDGLRSRAATAAQVASDQQDASEGFFANLKNGGADADRARAAAEAARREQTRLEAAASYIESHPVNSQNAIVDGLDPDALKGSLDLITSAGGTARERLKAVAAALGLTADAASRVADKFDPKVFASTNAQSIYEGLLNSPGFSTGTKPSGAGTFLNGLVNQTTFGKVKGPIGSTGDGGDLLASILSQSDIQSRLQTALDGIVDPSKLTPDQIRTIASKVVGDTGKQVQEQGGFDFADLPEIQDHLVEVVSKQLTELSRGTNQILAAVHITNEQVTAAVDQFVSDTQEVLGDTPQTAYGARIAVLQGLIRKITATLNAGPNGPGGNPEALRQLTIAQRQVAEETFAKLEAQRAAAQEAAGSQREAASIGRSFLGREINAAVKGGDPDLLAKIIAQAGDQSIKIARRVIQAAIKTVKAAIAVAKREYAVAQGLAPQNFEAAFPDLAPLQQLLNVTGSTAPADDSGDVYTGTGVGPKETGADRAVAAAQANAARKQGQIASARASILAAKVAMDQAKKGSVEYYNALGQYYEARTALSDAIIAYRQNLYLLGHDITNPLTQSRATLQAARAKLAADARSGAGGDQLAADRVAVQQAQADAESTKFQQRLSAVQTADELGRISHQKYLNYLQHEHDRLKGIKDRTYQQQQELDQVDQLMKAAADKMAGQWNFGDIKLPTPYEVQRRVQEVYGNAVGGLNHSSDPFLPGGATGPIHGGNVTNIRIDGSDLGAVRKILRELLGERATTTTTAARHR